GNFFGGVAVLLTDCVTSDRRSARKLRLAKNSRDFGRGAPAEICQESMITSFVIQIISF
ncbi:10929_t:CDS:1, partial [Ambispora gerdemannii]